MISYLDFENQCITNRFFCVFSMRACCGICHLLRVNVNIEYIITTQKKLEIPKL